MNLTNRILFGNIYSNGVDEVTKYIAGSTNRHFSNKLRIYFSSSKYAVASAIFRHFFPNPVNCLVPSHCTCKARQRFQRNSVDFTNEWTIQKEICSTNNNNNSTLCQQEQACQTKQTLSIFESPISITPNVSLLVTNIPQYLLLLLL